MAKFRIVFSELVAGLATRRRAVWNDTSFRAGMTRTLLLPLTSLAALYVAHIEITALDNSLFGVLALLLSISLLLPFADLGIGAAVTNAVATRGDSTEHEKVIAASLRLLLLVCLVVVLVGAVFSVLGLWGGLTGVSRNEAPHLNRDMLGVTVLFGLGLPLGVGGRILLGLDRYPLLLRIQGSIPFVTLGLVFGFRDSKSLTAFLLAPFLAQNAASFIALGMAMRLMHLPVTKLWSRHPHQGRRINRKIRRTAGPMMIISIGLPIALQTDRLVLSHVGTRADLSAYAIVSMLYVPAWSIISSAGMSLWPRFAGLGVDSERQRTQAYERFFRLFALAGGLGCLAFIVLGPAVTRQWAGTSGGSQLLWYTFGVLLLVQSAHMPGAMLMTHPAGLRFQAGWVITMCVLNVPLSVVLAMSLGAPGPVLASAVTILVLQLFVTRRRILQESAATRMTESEAPRGSRA
jgi:O-antigen/teichoic acid export membrane protein